MNWRNPDWARALSDLISLIRLIVELIVGS